MDSPYFHPCRKYAKSHFNQTSIQDKTISAGDLAKSDYRVLPNAQLDDPLFRFYFRKFLDLYQLLYALKPNLIQETVADDPWKLLVAVTLLNKTTGKLAIPVFWDIINRWKTPWEMSRACTGELKRHIYPLGIYNVRSRRLIEMSRAYVTDPPSEHDTRPSRPLSPAKRSSSNTVYRHKERYPSTPISHLPGTGAYALDSYRIFCPSHKDHFSDEWKAVCPTDKELVLYLRWKWAYEERKEWSPATGCTIPATIPYLESLVDELTEYRMRQPQPQCQKYPEHCGIKYK